MAALMSDNISIICPIPPMSMDRKMRNGFEDICRRVAKAAVLEGRGTDLLLRVYLAGLYHGAMLGAEKDRGES